MRGSILGLPVAWLATGAIVLGAAQTARACQVCYPFPRKSIADHLIEGETVVLAREDPQRAFHYRAIEVLKGTPPQAPIDLFLDGATRRILKFHPERSVLLAMDEEGTWRRAATVDATLLPLVRDVLKRAPEWSRNATARYDYFAKLFGHEHPVLRDLAHLEVARAPYSYLRKLGRGFPRDRILAALRDPRYMEWWALNILLLAQSGDRRDKQRIRDAVRSAEYFGSTLQLGAWATAFIEIEGQKAIEFFESRYFKGSRRDEELVEVVAAFSVHGNSGHTHLRDRIVRGYGVLLTRHPNLAPKFVGDLLAWQRWEMGEQVRQAAERCKKVLPRDDLGKLRWFAAMAARARRDPASR
jgi:hypothetical protein